jgi:hypothetical protein
MKISEKTQEEALKFFGFFALLLLLSWIFPPMDQIQNAAINSPNLKTFVSSLVEGILLLIVAGKNNGPLFPSLE